MSSKVSIQIVTFNSQRFIKSCLDSIFSQTFQDFSILIIDNASRDDTVAFIKERYSKNFIQEKFKSSARLFVVRNPKNTGFSYAHNQGIIMSKSDFVLVMNPDMILEQDFLKRLVMDIEKDKNIASVGGKLLRLRLGDPELDEKIKTRIIDTTGLMILKSRRIIDRGEGEKDMNQYDKKTNVFGISGACALYRRCALEDIKIPPLEGRTLKSSSAGKSEYFDNDFFAYKEDADLSWRLQLRAWKAKYVPGAVAYHFRAGAPLGRRFSQSKFVNFLSFRNHLWTLIKNSYWLNFLLHSWAILPYQLLKKFYLLFTQPLTFIKSGLSFCVKLPKIFEKRKYIMGRSKVGPKVMQNWFN